MAITYYYPNGNDGGWAVSTNTLCDDGFNPGNGLDNDVTGPNDATFITCTNQAADVLNLDTGVGSGEHTIVDGDTISLVRIKVRATLNASDADNNILVDLIIGGAAQGTQQETGHLTSGFVTYTLSTTGWDSDWTAAQIAGMQVRLTSEQGGMPSSYDVDVSEVEVEITYTAGVTTITADSDPNLEIPLITAAGTTDLDRNATGAPSIPLPTAAGSEFLWPRVYLNTSASKSGATEMTVTDANSAGTSITFDDAAGAPTGSIWLGVENQSNDGIAWIAVTVTASGADVTATGAPSIPLITAAGTTDLDRNATGAPSIPLPTASGASEIIKTAVGAATIALITAAGVGVIEKTASGAPEIPLITASGTSEVITTAVGAATIPIITASGTAEITGLATGSPTIALITASGTSTQERSSTGAVSIPLPTAAGTSEVIHPSTGAVQIPLITAAGTSSVTAGGPEITATGAPEIPLITTAGAAEVIHPATGAVSIPLPTAAGVSQTTKTSTGAVSIPLITASGTAEITGTAVGAPTIPLITAAGTSVQERSSTGSPSVPLITAAGTSKNTRLGVGSPSIPLVTAAGTSVQSRSSTGSPSVPLITAAGTGSIEGQIASTGAVSVPLPTASGTATRILTSTGSPSIPLITAAGTESSWTQQVTGAPSIPLITASGSSFLHPKVYLNTTQTLVGATEMTVTAANAAGTSATFDDAEGAPTGSIWLAVENRNNSEVGWIGVTVGPKLFDENGTGAVSIPLITASGSETTTWNPPDVYVTGGPVSLDLPLLTTSGTGETEPNHGEGAVSIPLPTAAGTTALTRKESGAANIPLITTAGSALSNKETTGAVTIPLITASGTGRVLLKARGPSYCASVAFTPNLHFASNFLPDNSYCVGFNSEPVYSKVCVLGDSFAKITIDNSLYSRVTILPDLCGCVFMGSGALLSNIYANGTPTIPLITASGLFIKTLATGAATVPLITTAGTASRTIKSTGAVTIPVITASGVTAHVATGAVSVPLITTSGVADADLGGDSYQLFDVGTALITDTNSAQTVPAATANVGDLLLVCMAANGSPTLFQPGDIHWDQLANIAVSDDRITLYGRIATGDADDVATASGLTTGVPQIAQMAAFTGNPWDPMTTNDIVNKVTTAFNDTSTTMDYPAITAASVTNTLSLICSVKIIDDGTEGASSGPDEAGFSKIGYEVSTLGDFDIMMSWAYRANTLAASAWDVGSWVNTNGFNLRTDGLALHLRSNDSGPA